MPARLLHRFVMPMQKKNEPRADETHSADELTLPRRYRERPLECVLHLPTNGNARATKLDAIRTRRRDASCERQVAGLAAHCTDTQRTQSREATKPTTARTANVNRPRARHEASRDLYVVHQCWEASIALYAVARQCPNFNSFRTIHGASLPANVPVGITP